MRRFISRRPFALVSIGAALVVGLFPGNVLAGGFAPPLSIGTLPTGSNSTAADINDSEMTVGSADTNPNGNQHAVVWTKNGGLTDLGTFGGPVSEANAVSNSGQVVGEAGTGPCPGACLYHAFSWTASAGITNLGTLPNGKVSEAFAVNNNGRVVGSSWISQTCCDSHPFSWTAGSGMVDMGSLGGSGAAGAVADNGMAVGESALSAATPFPLHAFVWTPNGGMVDIGTLGGDESGAAALNESGQVVGDAQKANGDVHAFIWTQAGGVHDLGTLGGRQSTARAINESGVVVGKAKAANGHYHAFRWTEATGMIDLGVLPGKSYSEARDINDAGLIVGTSWKPTNENEIDLGFAWTSADGLMSLQPLGGNFGEVVAVNNTGAIAGNSSTSGQKIRGVVWEPAAKSYQPDARIKKGSGPLAGDDTYNSTGTGQSKSGMASVGSTITFTISIQSDGIAADSFKVAASGPASPMYSVKYKHGSSNITAAIDGGTLTTPNLAPGATYVIKAKITVLNGATTGSSVTRLLTVTSVGEPTKEDAVRFTGGH